MSYLEAIVQNEAWDIPKYFVVDWKKYHKGRKL